MTVSGGPGAYWRALFNQGSEDLSGIRMLWTTRTIGELRDGLYYAFVAPWAVWWLAAAVLALAAVGVVILWRRDRPALTLVAIAFAPYFLFDLLFQETFTSRYALPLVVPIAFLAARGAASVPAYAGVAAAIAAAVFGAHVGGTSLAAYARQPTPAFRLLADMAAADPPRPAVLAPDRREALDLRAPVKYLGGAYPSVAKQLPSPPQREWLEAVNYWNAGGRAPVWLVVDPLRTTIDLIGHDAPKSYRWGLLYPVLTSGTRPGDVDWYVVDPPRWYVGEGWSLTPEAAGLTQGAQHRPIDAWVATRGLGALAIGGRNFSASPVDIVVSGYPQLQFNAAPGFFAQTVQIDSVPGVEPYLHLQIDTVPRSDVAFEQFDAGTTVMAFGPGWHEQEYNPTTGLRWRWMSDRADVLVAPPHRPVVLVIAGESPRKYFAQPSHFVVKGGGRVLFERTVSDDFSLEVPIADPPPTIQLETDQTYVPAERSRRTRDRRRLGLRIFTCQLRPASAPGR